MTYQDAYRPCAGDVVGTAAWAPGNRLVTAATLSERAFDGFVDDPADTVTYVVLGDGGYRESGPYMCTYDKWLEWVEGPGSRAWICNEVAP